MPQRQAVGQLVLVAGEEEEEGVRSPPAEPAELATRPDVVAGRKVAMKTWKDSARVVGYWLAMTRMILVNVVEGWK